MDFENNLQRLNEIIDEMEQGSASIEHSLALYEEAVGLVAQANEALAGARQKVSILQEQIKKPFEIEEDE